MRTDCAESDNLAVSYRWALRITLRRCTAANHGGQAVQAGGVVRFGEQSQPLEHDPSLHGRHRPL
jgi:hypothetical protein